MDEWREQTSAYALGALSTAERVEFEAHLLACDECATEVRSFGRVASALAWAAPPADVDVSVRERTLASLTEEGSSSPAARRPAPFDGDVRSETSRHGKSSGFERTRPVALWISLAASLALAIGLGAYSVNLRRAASEARTVVVVLAASDLVPVELAGQPVAPAASARAFWSQSRGLVFTASNLPPLPSGRTYQLWMIVGQTPIGAGVMKPGTDGHMHAVFATPSNLSKPAALAVTIEPDGGVPAPTGDKYLVGLLN